MFHESKEVVHIEQRLSTERKKSDETKKTTDHSHRTETKEEIGLRHTYEYFLESTETDPIPTLVIAKAVFGSNATKKTINRFLYELEKQKLIVKKCKPNGGDPRWNLRE